MWSNPLTNNKKNVRTVVKFVLPVDVTGSIPAKMYSCQRPAPKMPLIQDLQVLPLLVAPPVWRFFAYRGGFRGSILQTMQKVQKVGRELLENKPDCCRFLPVPGTSAGFFSRFSWKPWICLHSASRETSGITRVLGWRVCLPSLRSASGCSGSVFLLWCWKIF